MLTLMAISQMLATRKRTVCGRLRIAFSALPLSRESAVMNQRNVWVSRSSCTLGLRYM